MHHVVFSILIIPSLVEFVNSSLVSCLATRQKKQFFSSNSRACEKLLGINLCFSPCSPSGGASLSPQEITQRVLQKLEEVYKSFGKPTCRVRKKFTERALLQLAREIPVIARVLGYTHFLTLTFPSDEVGRRVVKRLREKLRKMTGSLPLGIRVYLAVSLHNHLFVKLREEEVKNLEKWLRKQGIKEKLASNWYKLQKITTWKFGYYFVKNLRQSIEALKLRGERVTVDKLFVGSKLVKELLVKDKTFREAFYVLLSSLNLGALRLGKPGYVKERNHRRRAIIYFVVRKVLEKLGYRHQVKKAKKILRDYNDEGVVKPSDINLLGLDSSLGIQPWDWRRRRSFSSKRDLAKKLGEKNLRKGVLRFKIDIVKGDNPLSLSLASEENLPRPV